MDVKIISPEKVMGQCFWCGADVGDNAVYGLSAKANPDFDLSKYIGKVVEINLVTEGRAIPMIVVTEESDAKKFGIDFIFMTCSEDCGFDIKETIEAEKSLSDLLCNIQPMD